MIVVPLKPSESEEVIAALLVAGSAVDGGGVTLCAFNFVRCIHAEGSSNTLDRIQCKSTASGAVPAAEPLDSIRSLAKC